MIRRAIAYCSDTGERLRSRCGVREGVATKVVVAWDGIEKSAARRATTHFSNSSICWVHLGVHQNWATTTRIYGITPPTSGCRTALPTLRWSTPICRIDREQSAAPHRRRATGRGKLALWREAYPHRWTRSRRQFAC
jgi:hypothetical protein